MLLTGGGGGGGGGSGGADGTNVGRLIGVLDARGSFSNFFSANLLENLIPDLFPSYKGKTATDIQQ